MGRAHKASTIIHEGQDKPKAKVERHYVDNKALFQALVERRQLVQAAEARGDEPPKITEFIGECFYKIADNLSKKYNFASLPFREEMVGQAIIKCIEKVDNFDPEVTQNPFSYFTQTCYFEFIGIITLEKNEKYVKYKSIIESTALNELATLDDKDASPETLNALNSMDVTQEYMEDFIKQYEEKNPPKEKGRRKKKARKNEEFWGEDK